ncbi:MAG: PDZ domain-containing protein [bacterium]
MRPICLVRTVERAAACLITLCILQNPARALADDMERSLVRVVVTSQGYDPFIPWQKTPPVMHRGYGVLIDSNRVLTVAQLIQNSTIIELQQGMSGEMHPAVVELSDVDANLAILRIVDPAGMKPLVSLPMAEKVSRESRVQIVQLNDTGEISRGDAKIVDISVNDFATTSGSILVFTALADINVNGQGAVVLHEGAVAGLIMWYDHNTRIGTMLPYPILKHFVSDAAGERYRGFAAAGFSWAPLVDPAERRYLKVDKHSGGIVVLTVRPRTGAAEALLPQDVILEWDGCAIDNLGFYDDRDFGRLALPYLIKGHRYPGDTVEAKIVRNGELKTVHIPLTRQADEQMLIPDNSAGARAEYLVDGGFLIRELTGDYMRAYGDGWLADADARLVHYSLTRADKPEQPGDRVVILSRVLADSINVGYQSMRDQVITHVNGEPVRNMADVFRLVEQHKGLRRMRMLSMSIDIVLDPETIDSANRRIMRTYQIPSLRFKRTETRTRD